MKILFVQAGGTIDKDYPRKAKGYAFEITEPAVKRILEKAGPNFDFEVVSMLKKDSMDITAADRDKVFAECRDAREDKIVVTHGTDTMLETAKRLGGIKGKAIVLTGAARPEKFSDSDAAFNVGTAVGAVGTVKNGVYVAMNGRVYPWKRCERDARTGQFVEKR